MDSEEQLLLHAADAATSAKQLGATPPGWHYDVLWSPDGKRVVYAVRHAVIEDGKSEYRSHIHIANADGSGAIQLTHGDKSCDDPQWFPQGQALAFASERSGKRNVWTIPATGGEAAERALGWAREGEWERASSAYTEAIRLEPHRAAYHACLARARWRASQRRHLDVDSLDDGGPAFVLPR